MPRNLRILVMAGVVAALVAWAWMRNAVGDRAVEPAGGVRIPTVASAKVQRTMLEERVEELASLRAPLTVNVAPRVTGRVLSILPFEGDAVREGQELARIESDELHAQLRRAQAVLAAAERRLQQARLGAEPQRHQVEASVEQARTELSTAQAELRRAQVAIDSRLAEAQTAIDEARATLDFEQKQLVRHEDLLRRDMIAAAEVDQVRTRVQVAEAQLEAARRRAATVEAEVRADVEVARETVQRAQARLTSALSNRAQNPMYEEQVASLEATVDEMRAGVENARAALEQTRILSPLTGYVTARLLDPGSVAGPTQPILTVMDIRTMWAEASISEEEAARITVGGNAQVVLDAQPHRPRTGRVVQVNPAANPQSRSFTVRVRLDNRNLTLKPGMSGRVVFEVRRIPNAMVVPTEAVTREEGRTPHVFVLDGETVRRVEVSTGLEQGGRTQITRGVADGQSVVVMGQDRLKDGDRVRVQ